MDALRLRSRRALLAASVGLFVALAVGCSGPAPSTASPLCGDVGAVRRLIAESQQGRLGPAPLLEQIQTLQSTFQTVALTGGPGGDIAAATAAAHVAVALADWKAALSVLSGVQTAQQQVGRAASQVPGCS